MKEKEESNSTTSPSGKITKEDYIRNRDIWFHFNNILPSDELKRTEILKQNLGRFGENSIIRSPFLCDIGQNVSIGNDVYINYGLTILGAGTLRIDDKVAMSSGCTIITVDHPGKPALGDEWIDLPKSNRIGYGTWIGANVTILPGVTIGRYCIIGAGSVVTKDIPDWVVAAGNPARVIRENDMV